MEKKKIRIKGNTNKKSLLLLKKNIVKNNDSSSLLELTNEVQKINHEKKIKILKPQIVKLDKNFNENQNILAVKNISKNLGGKPILKNISFSLKNSQILGLLGPNGAGKSTLFSLIVGKIFPDSGEITLHNKNIVELPIHKRALMGITLLEQHKGLFSNLTAYENLYAILELYMNDKNKIDEKIFQLLSYFDLKYLANIKAANMSGGEYKKISTLQRICNKNIKVLLLDEPMAALDPISIVSIKKFILNLKSMGLSIIITDHNFYAIQDILDNCLIIRDGNIMVQGPPKDVIKNENAIKYYLGSGFSVGTY